MVVNRPGATAWRERPGRPGGRGQGRGPILFEQVEGDVASRDLARRGVLGPPRRPAAGPAAPAVGTRPASPDRAAPTSRVSGSTGPLAAAASRSTSRSAARTARNSDLMALRMSLVSRRQLDALSVGGVVDAGRSRAHASRTSRSGRPCGNRSSRPRIAIRLDRVEPPLLGRLVLMIGSGDVCGRYALQARKRPMLERQRSGSAPYMHPTRAGTATDAARPPPAND